MIIYGFCLLGIKCVCRYCAVSRIHRLLWIKQAINFDKKQCYAPSCVAAWMGGQSEGNGYMCVKREERSYAPSCVAAWMGGQSGGNGYTCEKRRKKQCCHRFISSVSSVAQSCPTLCDPMNRSTPALPVHHQLPGFTQTHVQLPGFTQTHVHRVSDAIQPSHPLPSPSPPAPNPSQHQSHFQ